jgi:hypothetical protein
MGLIKRLRQLSRDVDKLATVRDDDFDADRPLTKADEKAHEARRADERDRRERGQR